MLMPSLILLALLGSWSANTYAKDDFDHMDKTALINYATKRLQEGNAISSAAYEFEGRFYSPAWDTSIDDQVALRKLSMINQSKTVVLLLGKPHASRYSAYQEEQAKDLLVDLVSRGYNVIYDGTTPLSFHMQQARVPKGRTVSIEIPYGVLHRHENLAITNSAMRTVAFSNGAMIVATPDSPMGKNLALIGIPVKSWYDLDKINGNFEAKHLPKVNPETWAFNIEDGPEVVLRSMDRNEIIVMLNSAERAAKSCGNSLTTQ